MSQVTLQMFDGQERYSSTTTGLRGFGEYNNLHQSTSSSTVPRAHAYTRGREMMGVDQEEMAELREEFAFSLGMSMPRKAEADCHYFMSKGIETGMIKAVIAETADAPHPSWRYACAIIYRLMRQGYYTLDGYYEDKARFEGRKEQKRAAKSERETLDMLGLL